MNNNFLSINFENTFLFYNGLHLLFRSFRLVFFLKIFSMKSCSAKRIAQINIMALLQKTVVRDKALEKIDSKRSLFVFLHSVLNPLKAHSQV